MSYLPDLFCRTEESRLTRDCDSPEHIARSHFSSPQKIIIPQAVCVEVREMDLSVKCLRRKHGDSNLDSYCLHEKPGMACACNTSPGKAETIRSLGLVGKLPQVNW